VFISSDIEAPPAAFGLAHGKRQKRESTANMDKKLSNLTSYSKPGVPTPAKGKRHNMDVSLNKSNGPAVSEEASVRVGTVYR
jgi:hypothetical protein